MPNLQMISPINLQSADVVNLFYSSNLLLSQLLDAGRGTLCVCACIQCICKVYVSICTVDVCLCTCVTVFTRVLTCVCIFGCCASVVRC